MKGPERRKCRDCGRIIRLSPDRHFLMHGYYFGSYRPNKRMEGTCEGSYKKSMTKKELEASHEE